MNKGKKMENIDEIKANVASEINKILDERKIPKISELRTHLDLERSKNRTLILENQLLKQEIMRLKLALQSITY